MKFIVFDIEANNLAYVADKFHVFAYARDDGQILYTNDREHIAALFAEPDTLFVCHNAVCCDKVLLLRLLGIDVPASKFVDSLALSWYLKPRRPKHGLASWGEDFGVPKPEIEDWDGLTYEEYAYRCCEDIKINFRLWTNQWSELNQMYMDQATVLRFISYLSFKMDCLREQEGLGWQIDYQAVVNHRDTLYKIVEDKKTELAAVMPKIPHITTKNRPKVMYKKDESLSKHGEAWFSLCQQVNLCPHATESLQVIMRYDDANPGSPQQVKKWLFSLGWQPCTFDYKREPDKTFREIPQVRKEGLLTDSVKVLIANNPAVEVLDGLSVAQHRQAIFQGMLDTAEVDENFVFRVKASASGLTNTLRFRHRKPLVNLPGVEKAWGKEVRGVLMGNIVGCDLVSLEDTTKRHFMLPHDPMYVQEMQQPGYDPHLSLAMFAGVITRQQYDGYTGQHDVKTIRTQYKTTNYAATYGIKAKSLARGLGVPQSNAQALLDAFWDKNWSINVIARDLTVKKIGRDKWLLNPVSGFYHHLRADKDRFSTLNQSTGVFVFDTFLACCRALGLQVIGQFHDEFIGWNWDTQKTEQILAQACQTMNNLLKLNVEIKYDFQVGNNYAEVH